VFLGSGMDFLVFNLGHQMNDDFEWIMWAWAVGMVYMVLAVWVYWR
jgi:hypothetical protein